MRAIVKNISILGVEQGEHYYPKDTECFCFNLRVLIGPAQADGEEGFDTQVMSPQWMIANYRDHDVVLGMNKIIMKIYDWALLQQTVEKYVSSVSGENWMELVFKLKGLGSWEFENYEI